MNITREQAICMFFSEECNDENVARLSKKISDFGSFDVCDETDPIKPVLVSLTRILSVPFTFKRYLTKHSTPSCDGSRKTDYELASELQVIAFLNKVFATTIDSPNENAYILKRITTNDICRIMKNDGIKIKPVPEEIEIPMRNTAR
ncbi:hypothetical protein BCR42DRAFT_397445 [Absidia repens]|uniref:Uncharacterized protein n=1 Tax=Absidia repens TaxID=90262 RepID=A0A1X2I192_9FUNG|nr:hypothetical protein BCR42DRAFT_397445 [Absidia repens]